MSKRPEPEFYNGDYLEFELAWIEHCGALADDRVLAARIDAKTAWLASGRPVPPHIKFSPPILPGLLFGKPTGTGALAEQVGGDHYKGKNIQPVEYIEANALPFLEGCIIKRATRHQDKNGAGVKDLKKIIHEARLIAQLRYGEEI